MTGSIGTPPPTFTQIKAQFTNDPVARDHHIRFQDGRGLYTSNKNSLASIKAFFGFGSQLQARQDKREAGVKEIKLAIDAEFGAGMGDRAFQRLKDKGLDTSHGIKGSQLGLVQLAIKGLQSEDQTAASRQREARIQQRTDTIRAGWHSAPQRLLVSTALADPRLASLESGQMSGSDFMSFFADNFDVCSSAAFFRASGPQVNADHIGCALSLSVLDRVQRNSAITAQDIADLQRTLGPFMSDLEDLMQVSAPSQVPVGLVGPITNDKIEQLTQLVFDRYADGSGGWELNLAGSEKSSMIDKFNNAPSGALGSNGVPMDAGVERLAVLKDALVTAASSQYMAKGAVSGALTAMQV